ncbi:hypothetical protein B7494_g2087 [Chlorociboria aeruginascens]|nr:hypothetical protein B7494_g2087 [Chlorociboria aeruginascens]
MAPFHGGNIPPRHSRHRESVDRTPYKTINSHPVLQELGASSTLENGNTSLRPQNQVGKRPREQFPNRQTNQSTGETRWMAKFCVEPPGDAATCCLAWWVPCILAGRNDWKLDRWDKGLPIESDHSVEARGCNMWCFFHLLAGSVCLERALIIIDRIRVRKVYGIEGHSGREIRARAGNSSLVTNKKDYPQQGRPDVKMTTHQQPTRPQPMRYVSPRAYMDLNPEQVAPPGAVLQNKKNVTGLRGPYASQVAAGPDKSSGKQQNNDDHEMDDLAPWAPHASQVAARLNKFEKRQQTYIGHDLKGVASDQSKAAEGHSAPSRKAKEGPTIRQKYRIKTDVETSSRDSATSASTEKGGEHSLDKCDVIHSKQVQELSYVHDFSDCLVDKSVLEHFEKQENRSRQHRAVSCIVQGSIKVLNDNEGSAGRQHRLASCPIIPTGSKSNHSQQHDVVSCVVQEGTKSYDENESTDMHQHRLTSCPVILTDSKPSHLQQHQENTRDYNDDEGTDIHQHRLTSCPIPSAGSKSKTGTSSHHVPENARIDGDSLRIEDQPSTDHTLRDCVVYATKKREGKVPGSNGTERNYNDGPENAGGASFTSKNDHGRIIRSRIQAEGRHNKGKDTEGGPSNSHIKNRNKVSLDASQRHREHYAQHAPSIVVESDGAREESFVATSDRRGSVRGVSEKLQS